MTPRIRVVPIPSFSLQPILLSSTDIPSFPIPGSAGDKLGSPLESHQCSRVSGKASGSYFLHPLLTLEFFHLDMSQGGKTLECLCWICGLPGNVMQFLISGDSVRPRPYYCSLLSIQTVLSSSKRYPVGNLGSSHILPSPQHIRTTLIVKMS